MITDQRGKDKEHKMRRLLQIPHKIENTLPQERWSHWNDIKWQQLIQWDTLEEPRQPLILTKKLKNGEMGERLRALK